MELLFEGIILDFLKISGHPLAFYLYSLKKLAVFTFGSLHFSPVDKLEFICENITTKISLNLLLSIIPIVIAIISLLIAIISLFISSQGNRLAKIDSIFKATEAIYNEWWSDDLRELRRYFFREFIPTYRRRVIGMGLKDIEGNIPEDLGRSVQLCFFFDRVGWLAAAGLIDVDYVLGPMQHVMRRTWVVMEPLIMRERELSKPISSTKKKGKYQIQKRFDPVYQFGFEWLFRRSSLPNQNQAFLVGFKFHRPHIKTKKEIKELRKNIEYDETCFRDEINDLLGMT